MKKITFIILAILSYSMVVFGQDQKKPDFSAEIDTQLWVHFKDALENRNAEKFISLHTDDIVRITPWGIREGQVFRDQIRKVYGGESKTARTIDFKFEHRIHSDITAYEVGYFRITSVDEQNQSQKYFGRFSVLLRKENGKWKIDQDWDVDQINGVPVTEADFLKL